VGNDAFDASVGLAFSLGLFERYRKNGVLQAKIHHVPGVRGHCQAAIHLVEGKVTSCYVTDNASKRIVVAISTLIRIDDERGPFEWHLIPLPAPPTMPAPPVQPVSSYTILQSPIPQVTAVLNLDILHGWSTSHKMMLSVVYEAIDGQTSIDILKQTVPLPPHIVEEALRILLSLKCITIQ
jgi:hypothetical protein